MKVILNRLSIPMQLIVILTFSIVIYVTIWKIFLYKDRAVAEDYKMLASIPAEEIIYYQKNKPESWKDYVAVSQGARNHQEETLKQLQMQLNKNVKFKDLNWSGVDNNMKKTARYYRQLIDKYPVYTPGKYVFPLKQTCYYEDTYGAGREGGKRYHQGTDLFDNKGTEIINVCSGIVEKLGWNRLGGERVGVRGEDGNYYYYAHLDKINQKLWIGQEIKQGELIGTMGNTGDAISTPDHLHFGIELPNGEWLNPYSLLKTWGYHKFGSM